MSKRHANGQLKPLSKRLNKSDKIRRAERVLARKLHRAS